MTVHGQGIKQLPPLLLPHKFPTKQKGNKSNTALLRMFQKMKHAFSSLDLYFIYFISSFLFNSFIGHHNISMISMNQQPNINGE